MDSEVRLEGNRAGPAAAGRRRSALPHHRPCLPLQLHLNLPQLFREVLAQRLGPLMGRLRPLRRGHGGVLAEVGGRLGAPRGGLRLDLIPLDYARLADTKLEHTRLGDRTLN